MSKRFGAARIHGVKKVFATTFRFGRVIIGDQAPPEMIIGGL
jgi:hypothetical protein